MNFFKNIQHKLLLHYPLIWNTRIIPVLLSAGVLNLFLFAFFFAVSTPQRVDRDGFVPWMLFLGLCSLIAVVVYLIYLFRFNYFKNFGLLRPFDFAFQFLLLFLALGSIIAWPFMPKLAAHVSVARQYSLGAIRADLEEAYLLAYQLEYTQASAPYRKMKIEIDESLGYANEDGVNNLLTVPSVKDIDSSRFVKMERNNDGTFTGYEQVYLVCGYVPYDLYDQGVLTDKIYKSLLPTTEFERKKKETRLNEIFAKYIHGYDGSIYLPLNTYNDASDGTEVAVAYDPSSYESRVCNRYRLSDMGDGMSDINSAIFNREDWQVFTRTWFYLTFYAALLLVIFRYMTPRTFLWTLLFTFLLFVFTVIFSIISEPDANSILAIMLFYYLVFLGFAVSIFFAGSRNVFQGIGLNLSFFFLQLFPVVLTVFVHDVTYSYDVSENSIIMAERVGLVLVLLSTLFLHSRLFYKWYSLPEE